MVALADVALKTGGAQDKTGDSTVLDIILLVSI